MSSASVRNGPSVPVEAPAPESYDFGLVSLANTAVTESVPSSTTERWELGYSYVPAIPQVAESHAQVPWTVTGADVAPADAYRGPKLIDTVPVVLTVAGQVSTMEFRTDDYAQAVRTMLDSYSSKLLEREFWTGEIADELELPNRRLRGADVIEITGGNPQRSVAAVAQAVSESGPGGGMIHVPMMVALMLPDSLMNGDLKEKYGVTIVPGSGYPTDGMMIYGTQNVNVRMSGIWLTPDNINDATDPRSNTIAYRAERYAAADFAGPVFGCSVAL